MRNKQWQINEIFSEKQKRSSTFSGSCEVNFFGEVESEKIFRAKCMNWSEIVLTGTYFATKKHCHKPYGRTKRDINDLKHAPYLMIKSSLRIDQILIKLRRPL